MSRSSRLVKGPRGLRAYADLVGPRTLTDWLVPAQAPGVGSADDLAGDPRGPLTPTTPRWHRTIRWRPSHRNDHALTGDVRVHLNEPVAFGDDQICETSTSPPGSSKPSAAWTRRISNRSPTETGTEVVRHLLLKICRQIPLRSTHFLINLSGWVCRKGPITAHLPSQPR